MPRWSKDDLRAYQQRRRADQAGGEMTSYPKRKLRSWTMEEITWMKSNYPTLGRSASATDLGKTTQAIRTMASKLGLKLSHESDHFRKYQERAARSKVGKKQSPEHIIAATNGRKTWWSQLPEEEREKYRDMYRQARAKTVAEGKWSKGHPESLKAVWADPKLREKRLSASRAASQRIWNDPSHRVNSNAYRQKMSDAASAIMRHSASESFSRTRKGFRSDIGISTRSSWEANYARYLNFLIKTEGKIERWEYEATTFWFHTIKRGCRSYKPDFKVILKNGDIEYHEVKGWMYPRAKTALNRMRIYYPDVRVVLIDEHRYRAIEKQLQSVIQGWERRKPKAMYSNLDSDRPKGTRAASSSDDRIETERTI